MNLLALLIILLTILTMLMLFMGSSLCKKSLMMFEKMSPFECGFNTKYNARLPFSLRFFMVCLIFLIFDVELVLLFPYLMSLKFFNNVVMVSLLLTFILVLVMGLAHEWNQGSLDWTQ